MRAYNTILIIAVIIPIVSIGTFFLYNAYTIEEVHTIESHVQVCNYYGVNRGTDKLYLGSVKAPGSAYRNFTVSNNADEPRKIRIELSGDQKDFAMYYPANFVLGPHENKSVHYFVSIDRDLPHGNYTSIITVYYLKYNKLFYNKNPD